MEVQEHMNEFDEAKNLFISTGTCKHNRKWFEESRPYNCNLTLTLCKVCNKVMFKVFDN